MYIKIDLRHFSELFTKAATGDPRDAQEFFRQFSFNEALNKGEILSARIQIFDLLSKMKAIDEEKYEKIHKGGLFYFLAITSFLINNYGEALFFFDAAVSEDMKNDSSILTPSYSFMLLDPTNQYQAALKLTEYTSKKLSSYITRYNKLNGSFEIDFHHFQKFFLIPSIGIHKEWRTLVTSLISYILDGDHINQVTSLVLEQGSHSIFLHYLTDGCLLLESLLKASPLCQDIISSKSTLGQILNDEGVRNRLRLMNALYSSNLTLGDIKHDLTRDMTTCEDTIFIVARLRNVIEHNLLSSSTLTNAEYNKLIDATMFSIIHVISLLFRTDVS